MGKVFWRSKLQEMCHTKLLIFKANKQVSTSFPNWIPLGMHFSGMFFVNSPLFVAPVEVDEFSIVGG